MKRHPCNTAFEWADHTGPTRRLSAAEVQQFDADGYVVLPNLLDAATVAEVRADLDEQEAEVDAFLQNRQDRRFSIAEIRAGQPA